MTINVYRGKTLYLIDPILHVYKITSYTHCLRAVSNKVICAFKGYVITLLKQVAVSDKKNWCTFFFMGRSISYVWT